MLNLITSDLSLQVIIAVRLLLEFFRDNPEKIFIRAKFKNNYNNWQVNMSQKWPWLRWWDAEGNLLLTSQERAEQERQRADRLAEQLRALGVEPEA